MGEQTNSKLLSNGCPLPMAPCGWGIQKTTKTKKKNYFYFLTTKTLENKPGT